MQQNIYEQNFAKLRSLNSQLADFLLNGQFNRNYQIQLDAGKEATLIVDSRQLTSHHDREGLAAHYCRKLDFKKEIHIYGFGLGDEIRYILQQTPNAQIFVHLLNPGLFNALLSIDDSIHELFVSNVNFLPAGDDTPYFANSIIITPELYIDQITCNSIKGKLLNILDYDYAVAHFNSNTGLINKKNLKDNYQILKSIRSFDTKVIREQDSNNAVMIAASGPSLADNINTIRKYISDGVKLIALDTALSCLLEKKITPNFVISTDPVVYRNLSRFIFPDMEALKNTTLIFSAHSEKALIESFPGPKYFIYKNSDLEILEYLPKAKADYISYSGSVLNEAVAIAIKANYKTVKLFGADFAFKGETTHSGSVNRIAVSANQKLHDVVCNDGSVQKTVKVFNLYRQYLEDEIIKHKDIRFENYSKTGAVIKGAVKV